MLYYHDTYQLVVLHPASGWVAFADRLDVETAPEPRRVSTSFVELAWLRRHRTRFPNGHEIALSDSAKVAWYDAVKATLDTYADLPPCERYFANLQQMWSPT